MHWIKATNIHGTTEYLNLDAIPRMTPGTQDGQPNGPPCTIIWTGGMGVRVDGTPVFMTVAVKESIAELAALPRLTGSFAQASMCDAAKAPPTFDAARVGAGAATPHPEAPSVGAAPATQAPNAEAPQSFPDPGSTKVAKSRDRFRDAKAARRAKR